MIKAIETRYAGCRFRSRLEARWAVYFDTLGIGWEYEKEGFNLDGVFYLPDFWLPQVQMWAEVKPVALTREEESKVCSLAEESGFHALMLVGPPDMKPYWAHVGHLDQPDYPPTCDYILDAQYLDENRFYGCTGMGSNERLDPAIHRDIARAVEAARSARFEHGESGR